jgi:hypothetical protein
MNMTFYYSIINQVKEVFSVMKLYVTFTVFICFEEVIQLNYLDFSFTLSFTGQNIQYSI